MANNETGRRLEDFWGQRELREEKSRVASRTQRKQEEIKAMAQVAAF